MEDDQQLWRAQSACEGKDPNLWFPSATQDEFVSGKRTRRETSRLYGEARQICLACPVRIECLDYALRKPEEHGMWGGLTASERSIVRRTRRKRPVAA